MLPLWLASVIKGGHRLSLDFECAGAFATVDDSGVRLATGYGDLSAIRDKSLKFRGEANKARSPNGQLDQVAAISSHLKISLNDYYAIIAACDGGQQSDEVDANT